MTLTASVLTPLLPPPWSGMMVLVTVRPVADYFETPRLSRQLDGE